MNKITILITFIFLFSCKNSNIANIYLRGKFLNSEVILELKGNKEFKAKLEDYPENVIYGKYEYNPLFKNLKLWDFETDFELKDIFGNIIYSKRVKLKEYNSDIPDSISLKVKEWSIDRLICIDYNGVENNFYKVSDFSFSENVNWTNFNIIVKYPDNSKDGKRVAVEIKFKETTSPPISIDTRFIGDKGYVSGKIPDRYLSGEITNATIVAYISDDNRINYSTGLFNSNFCLQLSGNNFTESSYNPWQKEKFYKIEKGKNNNFVVEFPKRLNIRMIPDDFSTNNPVIKWDSYPGATKYLVLVIIPDKESGRYDREKNPIYDIAYSEVTTNREIKVYSEKLLFKPVRNTAGFLPSPVISKGELIRIEVYALDNSGILNTREYKGALFMDYVNIIR